MQCVCWGLLACSELVQVTLAAIYTVDIIDYEEDTRSPALPLAKRINGLKSYEYGLRCLGCLCLVLLQEKLLLIVCAAVTAFHLHRFFNGSDVVDPAHLWRTSGRHKRESIAKFLLACTLFLWSLVVFAIRVTDAILFGRW
eukprot:NODE_4013_length_877_cov_16.516908_g3699_i0.p1 GENE.NODE_4013_length_877_cov_16.516908_g3699_i0~~NODE_4013_length_877_cov_16.516908_g3699_i0.p1  ORF type:complete len:141 (+),score=22.59 NODE_4013_length_877_cov_16.516908_g3699_i0:185-607(+)